MHLDIFNDDAFSLSQLSLTMADQVVVPGQLGAMGLFEERGINTLTFSIEKKGASLSLVPTSARGSRGPAVGNGKRSMRHVGTVHLQEQGAVYADAVQGVRAFGSETELMTAQSLVNDQLMQMRMNLDATIEHLKVGAVRGQLLDADGTTVLEDMFDLFGITKSTLDMVLDNAATDVLAKCVTLRRLVDSKLVGLSRKSITALCSPEFFDALTLHAAVRDSYDRFEGYGRDIQVGKPFRFGGVDWVEYEGSVGGTPFIPAGKALAIPTGVPGMFVGRYSPADYMETVNTIGLPYYAKQWRMQNDKGVELEGQTNPIFLNTRPDAVIELSI